jgi:hypothetical protein
MATDDPQHFRFMDLPTELRLVVYQRIPRQIHYTNGNFVGPDVGPRHLLILITRTCSVALLRVSKAVTLEAQAIMRRVVKEWMLSHPPRVLASSSSGLAVLRPILASVWKE